jgi:hypothetical protein
LWPEKEEKEQDRRDDEEEEESISGSDYSGDEVDGTSPAVIAQVSELLNYVYGKTSVPGQIDRVSTIMRAYEGREAVLLELLETKALIKANKEKENADQLPSFLRNSQAAAHKNADEIEAAASDLPPVTPMAQAGNEINDEMSSMSGVSSPAAEREQTGAVDESEEVDITNYQSKERPKPMSEAPKINASSSATKMASKPPATPDKDRKKKKGLFGGLFGGKKKVRETGDPVTPGRANSRSRRLRGVTSVEGSV